MLKYLFIPIFYLLICIFLYSYQTKLIYFPSYEVNSIPTDVKKLILDNKLLGYEISSKKEDTVIVIFHGNAGNAIDRLWYQDFFKEHNLFLAEYTGYGENKNLVLNKNEILNHADSTILTLKTKYKNIIVLGESLGSGVASYIASKHDLNKLILVTPYDSIRNVAKERFWFLPLKYLLTENFDSIEYLKNYKYEVLTLIAEKDEVIDPKFAYALTQTINSNTLNVKNANHNNWMNNLNAEQIQKIENYVTMKR